MTQFEAVGKIHTVFMKAKQQVCQQSHSRPDAESPSWQPCPCTEESHTVHSPRLACVFEIFGN